MTLEETKNLKIGNLLVILHDGPLIGKGAHVGNLMLVTNVNSFEREIEKDKIYVLMMLDVLLNGVIYENCLVYHDEVDFVCKPPSSVVQ